MAHTARDGLRAYKEQHGIEQNFGFLKDPLIVNSLFLKKPERIEALGLGHMAGATAVAAGRENAPRPRRDHGDAVDRGGTRRPRSSRRLS